MTTSPYEKSALFIEDMLSIIDKNGDLVSTALPQDMLPESDTTVETG